MRERVCVCEREGVCMYVRERGGDWMLEEGQCM